MSKIFTVTILIAASSIGHAQSPDEKVPKALLGFFTPGMHVGVQSVEGTTNVIVHTYSDTNFAVAKEIASRGSSPFAAKEFAEHNEVVRIAIEQHLEKLDSANLSDSDIWMMPLMRTELGRVMAVGDDYVLVEIDSERKSRLAIRDSSLSKVYFDATPIRLFFRPSRDFSSNGT